MEKATRQRKTHKLEPLARNLYVNKEMLQKEIAVFLGLTELTISKWKVRGKWDVERFQNSVTPGVITSKLYKGINKILDSVGEEIIDSKTSDNIKKLSSTIKDFDKSFDAVVALDVFNGFTRWLITVDSEAAQKIVDYQKEYVKKLANEQ
jgi:hypothetical protein